MEEDWFAWVRSERTGMGCMVRLINEVREREWYDNWVNVRRERTG